MPAEIKMKTLIGKTHGSRQRGRAFSCRTLAHAPRPIHTDFLVVGSGIAGITAALELAPCGKVTLVSKGEVVDSNTAWAQGGICGALGDDDSVEQHAKDTMEAGVALCEGPAVNRVCEEGPHAIKYLLNIGTKFDRSRDGKLDMHREGGHKNARVAHVSDRTGQEIERALVEAAWAEGNITIHEHHFASDLLLSVDADGKDRCCGIEAIDMKSEERFKIASSSVIIATGGAGHVYPVTTNPSIATGDGVAMAHRAGARIANMEFVQFHPTGLYREETERGIQHPCPLITEAVRGAGGILLDARGQRFMHKYHKDAELAPRDVVARAIDCECKRSETSHLHLSLEPIPDNEKRKKFPNLLSIATKYGLNAFEEPLPVAPAAHYMCGGIWTDSNAESNVRGLLACGEAAYTGLHGANRLASNSLLEGVVYGRAAAQRALKLASSSPPMASLSKPTDSRSEGPPSVRYGAGELRAQVLATARANAGIVRDSRGLHRGVERAEVALSHARGIAQARDAGVHESELLNVATVLMLILKCASRRKESRGLHYNADFPRSHQSQRRPTLVEPPSRPRPRIARKKMTPLPA